MDMEFSPTVSQCISNGCSTREKIIRVSIRIIPEINFTCTGTVTHWRADGTPGDIVGIDLPPANQARFRLFF